VKEGKNSPSTMRRSSKRARKVPGEEDGHSAVDEDKHDGSEDDLNTSLSMPHYDLEEEGRVNRDSR
jgi:hypothetical protein